MLLFPIKDLFAPVFVRDGLLDAPPFHAVPGALRWADRLLVRVRSLICAAKNGYHNAAY